MLRTAALCTTVWLRSPRPFCGDSRRRSATPRQMLRAPASSRRAAGCAAVGEQHLIDGVVAGGHEDRLDADLAIGVVEPKRAYLSQRSGITVEPRLSREPRGEQFQLGRVERGLVQKRQEIGQEQGWGTVLIRSPEKIRAQRQVRRPRSHWRIRGA